MDMQTKMQGKVVLITGATNGIGKATALGLARLGATTVIVGRSRAKTEAVVREIKDMTNHPQVDMLLADLSSLAEVRRVVDEFTQKYRQLHVLINNAGALFGQPQVSVDGYKMSLALNHLSPFLLTTLLLPVFTASAPARIVTVSLDTHTLRPLNLDDVQHETSYPLGDWHAYGQSKLMNVLFTYALADRLRGSGVTANVLHPGAVATGIGTNSRWWQRIIFTWVFPRWAQTPAQGAQTSIYLAASPQVAGVSGKHFVQCQAVASSPASYNVGAQQQLWRVSEELPGDIIHG